MTIAEQRNSFMLLLAALRVARTALIEAVTDCRTELRNATHVTSIPEVARRSPILRSRCEENVRGDYLRTTLALSETRMHEFAEQRHLELLAKLPAQVRVDL